MLPASLTERPHTTSRRNHSLRHALACAAIHTATAMLPTSLLLGGAALAAEPLTVISSASTASPSSLVIAAAADTPVDATTESLVELVTAIETIDSTDAASGTGRKTDVVYERYPNRAIKIERHVTTDSYGNIVNHGQWTMFAEDGSLLGGGRYEMGVRQGPWVRYYRDHSAELLQSEAARRFSPPFKSTAQFNDDRLHGVWRIVDARGREVVALSYDHGCRHGKHLWRHANSNLLREMPYEHDLVHGTLVERDAQGTVTLHEQYQQGRRLGSKLEFYPSGEKKTVAEYRFAKERIELTDHWWDGVSREKLLGVQGTDERHGKWLVWYEDGQQAHEGNYQQDQAQGTFHWWFPNGQKAIEGRYVDGQQSGQWFWWYEDGTLRIEGDFLAGTQDGHWRWFSPTGQLVESATISTRSLPDLVEDAPQLTPTPRILHTSPAPTQLRLAEPSGNKPTLR